MTSFTLKIIAVVSMFIDHIGYIYISPSAPEYLIFRGIGRLAFPIFVYLIVEGCQKTSNINKYLFRLFIFALISEIPFDYAFSNVMIEFTHQNIFFTLCLGVLSIYVYKIIKQKEMCFNFLGYASPVIFAAVAELIHTDYGGIGVIIIFFLYIYREERFLFKAFVLIIGDILLLLDSHWIQILAVLSVFPLYYYNGKRGMPLKYFFYLFYPLHLLILGLFK